jgi:predicted RNA binding protein YcfA (HicA-like mRNA interferase family)
MSRVRKGREIDAALNKKGFRRETDGDHVCYSLTDSKIQTKVSHGAMGDTIGTNLMSRMARQLHLTKTQFLDLIDCTLNEDGYREILRGDLE